MSERQPNLLQQLGRSNRAMYGAFEGQVGQALPRWRVLKALEELGTASQKRLACHLQMDPGALTRQLKPLEAEKLVRRNADPADNRQTLVTLDAAGEALLREAAPQRQAFFDQALSGIDAESLETAMRVLRQLEERFRSMGR
ncbi:MarR family transcriptional regulator [Chromobacterium phragmitis]|uniref:MarR family transcriptional regulator n=1 Tax=Chromobacterium phragmitis TaxID=2202141 RepID=A0A344UJI4_9NEIS|nr:MarR family transcriptional regulator [Chromobacterium phragmitis]AXE30041.1 MarR family transcriptional regulator [Chromobacterium phragmitis]AXE35432.1 MarR family transcriptional regulator [Chromobacterium phragmitis]